MGVGGEAGKRREGSSTNILILQSGKARHRFRLIELEIKSLLLKFTTVTEKLKRVKQHN